MSEAVQSSLPDTAGDWATLTLSILSITAILLGALFGVWRSLMRLVDQRIQAQIEATVRRAVSIVLENGITGRLSRIEDHLMGGHWDGKDRRHKGDTHDHP